MTAGERSKGSGWKTALSELPNNQRASEPTDAPMQMASMEDNIVPSLWLAIGCAADPYGVPCVGPAIPRSSIHTTSSANLA